ncbi:MAG TPA: hypothetical protein VGK19_00115 [Capsulimonadaceae bacterium]|jgi:hypothetical protein
MPNQRLSKVGPLLAVGSSLLVAVAGISVPLPASRAAGAPASAHTTVVPAAATSAPTAAGEHAGHVDDGDLVYHWQDLRYSQEMSLQITGAAAFLAIVTIASQVAYMRVRGRSR